MIDIEARIAKRNAERITWIKKDILKNNRGLGYIYAIAEYNDIPKMRELFESLDEDKRQFTKTRGKEVTNGQIGQALRNRIRILNNITITNSLNKYRGISGGKSIDVSLEPNLNTRRMINRQDEIIHNLKTSTTNSSKDLSENLKKALKAAREKANTRKNIAVASIDRIAEIKQKHNDIDAIVKFEAGNLNEYLSKYHTEGVKAKNMMKGYEGDPNKVGTFAYNKAQIELRNQEIISIRKTLDIPNLDEDTKEVLNLAITKKETTIKVLEDTKFKKMEISKQLLAAQYSGITNVHKSTKAIVRGLQSNMYAEIQLNLNGDEHVVEQGNTTTYECGFSQSNLEAIINQAKLLFKSYKPVEFDKARQNKYEDYLNSDQYLIDFEAEKERRNISPDDNNYDEQIDETLKINIRNSSIIIEEDGQQKIMESSLIKKMLVILVYRTETEDEFHNKHIEDVKKTITIANIDELERIREISDIKGENDKMMTREGLEYDDSDPTMGDESFDTWKLDRIIIKYIKETQLGSYHFKYHDDNSNKVTFDIMESGNHPIYTSKLTDNNCVFHTLIAALNRFTKISKDGKEIEAVKLVDEINAYRRDNIISNKKLLPMEHLKKFFLFLNKDYTFFAKRSTIKDRITDINCVYTGNSQMLQRREKTTLRVAFFKYCNHLFFCDMRTGKGRTNYSKYIADNFEPLPFTNSLEDDVINSTEIDYVKMANNCNMVEKTAAVDQKQNYLLFSADLESANINNKQVMTHMGIITYKRIGEAVGESKFYAATTWKDAQIYIENQVRKYTKETKAVSNILLTCWNGGKYDFPLFDFTWKLKTLRGAKNNLPTYELNGRVQLKCVDAMSLVVGMGSLSNTSKAFEVENPKMKVQAEYFFDCLTSWYKDEKFEWKPDQSIVDRMNGKNLNPYDYELVLLEYLEADCRSQGEIIGKFIDMFESKFNIFPLGFTSNAGISGRFIKNNIKSITGILFDSNLMNALFKECMVGGRTLMMAQYYKTNKIITKDNWKKVADDTITYIDAVSLYPSAMHHFRYPTSFIEAAHGSCEHLDNLLSQAKSIDNIDNILQNSLFTYIVKVNIENPRGLITVASERLASGKDKGCLRHGHKQSQIRYLDLSTLLQSIYLNDVDYEILEYYKFNTEKCFDFVQELFDLRLEYKKEGNSVGSAMIKLILNSLYGKTCEKFFEDKIADHLLRDLELTDVIRYHEEILYKFKQQDTSGKLYHIAAFILANSKWLMNRVIDTLGGAPGNFLGVDNQMHEHQQLINGKWHYPFFATDTDSAAVWQSDFLRAKEFLADSKINPNTNALGGFHIDVEPPASETFIFEIDGKHIETTDGFVRDKYVNQGHKYYSVAGFDMNENYQCIITEAAWICSKTYILKCQYIAKDGSIKIFYHRRAKGIPAGWVSCFTCQDYIKLSQITDKEDRKTCKYAMENGLEIGTRWRFILDKAAGTITKDTKFDRAFPYKDLIGKHRVENEKAYRQSLIDGIPVLLATVNY